ncbi:hypothetical protein F5148DRAFT_1187964 [Russula earlei]|uniref:Uncharacterized protein n=1 Tax=Russula earlei TaxID=71964 RepID=A0ACC0UDV6_9AGAM|nr:hypothetical protein F5148DRAFT_1187964 [Russula earlei]
MAATASSHAANTHAMRSRISNVHAAPLSGEDSPSDFPSISLTQSGQNRHQTSLIMILRCSVLWVLLTALMARRPTKVLPVGPPSALSMIFITQCLTASASLAPALQMTVPSVAARPRSSLLRAGSLTERNLTANASRLSRDLKDGYDSSEWSTGPIEKMHDRHSTASGVDSTTGNESSASTPERRDGYHHHRASHSLAGSPLPQEFPRQRTGSTHGDSRSPSLAGSSSSIADFRDRMKDMEKESQLERERGWNKPRSAHSRTTSHTGPAGHSPRLSPDQQRSIPNGSDTHVHNQTQSARLRHSASRSSLHSEGSSRSSSPLDRQQTGRKDEEEKAIHERERNWGSRQQKWSHNHVHKRATSPTPAPSHARARTVSLESDSSAPPMSSPPRPPNGHLKVQAHTERHETSTSPQPRPVNGRAHDKPLRLPSRFPRLIPPSGVNGNNVDGKDASPASAPPFGWQFPRNRPQLPDFEPETSTTERSPSPVHRPTSHLVGFGKPSHIPVRSPGRVPKVEIKWNGDVHASFKRGHKRATTEFTEANGAVPPKIHFQKSEPDLEPEFGSGSDENSPRGSDESMQDAPTPMARTIEIPPVEELHSSSPVGNTPSRAEGVLNAFAAKDHDSLDAVPAGVAPSELSTPLRPHPSFSTSKIEFETPPPPTGLPELPGPPSSEDDTENIGVLSLDRQKDGPLNLTATKTPRPPGAWAATPAPVPARSQTPQPATSSLIPAKMTRTRSNSLPQTSFSDNQSSIVAPGLPSALSRAGTLPSRTPAPPGSWFSTPGSLRRKGLMKVRFDTVTSDSATSDADTGAKEGKAETSLPVADWDATSLAGPGLDASESVPEASFDRVTSSTPAPASSTPASRDGQEADDLAANVLPDSTTYTTAGSSPRRKARRSPSVRLVDEYGRAREDQPITPSRNDIREHSVSMRMPGGGPLKTPRNASVRILDAMGHEVEEPSEQNDSEDTVTEVRYSRQEALQRMKRAVADLQEGLRGVDAELYDLSKAAREMRSQLASSLQQAQTAHKYGSLKESMRKSRFLHHFLPERTVVSWNHSLFWGLLFFQFILFLFMYRMSKIHARHHFLTSYFDPFYGDLYIHPNKPEYNYDTKLFSFLRRQPSEPSYAERLGIEGPIDLAKRSIANVIAQVQRFMWESWGGGGDDRVRAWPPT